MNQAYSQELRNDTTRIIIPTLTGIFVLISLILTVSSVNVSEVWHFWVIAIVAPVMGWFSWNLLRRERVQAGTTLFLTVQICILSLLLYQEWQPGGPLPYFFGVLIIASSMFKRAESGIITWGVASFVITFVAIARFDLSVQELPLIAGPIVVNLFLACMAYLSAVEWQYAVESVSDLHRNVQRRRDELFQIQEEVKWANVRLEASNKKLDLARQEALTERDIRTRFMNHVSHELRTPLNAIVNFAHILRLGGRGAVTEGQIDYLERIEKSGWHLLSVLNDLLDMAQIQAGEFKLHLELCDLHALCEEAMTSTRGLLLDSEVDLARIYPEVWPMVKVDKMRIKQALINLLGNAVKYTEEGLITLQVRTIGDEVHVSVIDSGIGIAPEHHETIFMEFRQVNESAARKRVGTGLGLPITRHLIERHGGAMFLTSEPGHGSNFTIVLPVYDGEVENTMTGANGAPAPEMGETAVTLAPENAFETIAPAEMSAPEPVLSGGAGAPQAPLVTPVAYQAAKSSSRKRWLGAAAMLALVLALVWGGYQLVANEWGGATVEQTAMTATPTEAAPVAVAAEPTDTPTTAPSPTATTTATATTSPTAAAASTNTPAATVTDAPTQTPAATVTVAAAATTAVSATPEITNIATALLNSSLYQSADADSAEVTFVYAGDPITVSGRSENNNWLFVQTADGLSGFVFGERVQWNGDVTTLPVVNDSGDSPTATPTVTSELGLDIYPLPGVGRCEGQTWTRTIYMRGQGGNGIYTYFWDGAEIAAAVVNDSVTFEVSYTGGALTGVGEVISGNISVAKVLFIPPPSCG